ncbi:MFS transporter [Novosphingobium sp.]|uniref:MFS transporter n=1 Tax=Novosphingobium sp. TaxID=1874826 RepID=UPI002FE1EBE4
MTTTPDRPPIDPVTAVRAVLGAGLGVMLGGGAMLFHSAGVFVLPIVQGTGWSRVSILSAIGFTAVVFGLMSPVTGYFVDRLKPRRFALFSLPLLGLGLALVGILPTSALGFQATMILASILGAGQAPHAYTYSLNGLFDRRRGLALGICLSFSGIGLALVAPLATALIGAFGWRLAYVVLGAIVAVLGLFVAAFLVVDPPRSAKASEAQGTTVAQALRTRRFWLLICAAFLIAGSVGAGTVHMPIVAAARGIAAERAALALGLLGISTIASRLILGYFLDRFPAPLLCAIAFIAPGIAHLLLIHADGYTLFAAALLYGVGFGVEMDALAYLTASYFGLRHFGKIFGVLFLAIGVGTGFGPVLVGMIATTSAGYPMALATTAVGAWIAALLMLMLGGASQLRRCIPVGATAARP